MATMCRQLGIFLGAYAETRSASVRVCVESRRVHVMYLWRSSGAHCRRKCAYMRTISAPAPGFSCLHPKVI